MMSFFQLSRICRTFLFINLPKICHDNVVGSYCLLFPFTRFLRAISLIRAGTLYLTNLLTLSSGFLSTIACNSPSTITNPTFSEKCRWKISSISLFKSPFVTLIPRRLRLLFLVKSQFPSKNRNSYCRTISFLPVLILTPALRILQSMYLKKQLI